MTLEIGLLFAVLAVMAYFFFTEKLPIEITAFLGLLFLILGGYIDASEAFMGFSSPAVITMLCIFFLSAALLHTGVAEMVGKAVQGTIGGREVLLIGVIMLVAGVLSAFMNNIAATAVLLPAVSSISRKTQVSPSRLFIPLSFGAILGGTTTLVGTPPNILAGDILRERGLQPFNMFDFTPVGLALLLGGVLFMITVGRHLLPKSTIATAAAARRDLALEYQLHEALFTMRISPDSEMDGVTLGQARLGSTLGVQVVAISRDGEKILAPMAHTVLRGGDVLEVKGRLSDLQGIFQVGGLEMSEASSEDVAGVERSLRGIAARIVPGSAFIGRTLRDLRFRQRYGAMVAGIRREGKVLVLDTARIPLQENDEIFVLASPSQLEDVALAPSLQVTGMNQSMFEEIREHLFLLRIPADSSLIGQSLRDSRMGELTALTILGVLREDDVILGVEPRGGIREGDRLLVAGDESRIRNLLGIEHVHVETSVEPVSLESEEVGVVEVTLSPRSRAAGRSLADLNFRDKHGLQVLAIWRGGRAIHTRLAENALRFGDALLLQGPWNRIRALGSDPDYLVLSPLAQETRRTEKAWLALLGLLIMVGFVVTGFQPIHVAAFTAAIFVVLARTITMEEAYRAVEWRAIFLVAAILPVGLAMERTGAALLLSSAVTSVAGPLGETAVLLGMLTLSSFLSQTLDGAPSVVLLAPVALETAGEMGMNARTIMMGISLAASAAFMTPFSHKANLLVMGAGGYRMMDYLRVGTPLTLVLLGVMVLLVPVFFPL